MSHASLELPWISTSEPDLSREARSGWRWQPSRALLASIRCWQRYKARSGPWSWAMRKLAVLRHRFWSVVTGADIPVNSQLGGGLVLPHPNGVVIHPDALIGPNCMFFQQVTVGASRRGVPTIGAHVEIGAGAKIIGPVTIGDHAQIGANAVVTCDVPAGATAVGIPARVLVMGQARASMPASTPGSVAGLVAGSVVDSVSGSAPAAASVPAPHVLSPAPRGRVTH